jgi:EmrB/QacA subfamily drug resistance transporter
MHTTEPGHGHHPGAAPHARHHDHAPGAGDHAAVTGTGERRSWAVLALALVAQVLVVLDISVVNTALPTIGADLGLSSSDLQWVVTAYLLVSGGGLLLGGRLADLVSGRRVLLTGLSVFTAASLASGFASDAGVLIGARAAQGFGAALMTPAALALIMTTYQGAQRAKGLALWGAVGGLGIAAGVLVGGLLTTFAGWQMIFWVNVPIGAAAIIAALVLLPRTDAGRAGLAALDLPGALTAVGGLAALVVGIENAASSGWISVTTLVALGISASLLVMFAVIERRVAHPLVPPRTWRITSLVSGTGVMLGITGLLVGAVFLSSIFFHTVLGYSALQAGLAFLPLAVVITIGTRLGSHLLAHLPARTLAAAGLVLTAAGAFWLSTAPVDAGFAADVLPGLLLAGTGIGMVFVSVSVSAMTGIPAEHAGVASGFLMTGHEIGAGLGVAVLAAVATAAGDLTTSAGASAGFAWGFRAAAGIAIVLAVMAFATMPATRSTGRPRAHVH